MSSRNNFIAETIESRGLKELRIKSGLSLRILSERLSLSKTRVYQMEIGRENINVEYIKKFLEAIDLRWSDWKKQIGHDDQFFELRGSCHCLLDKIKGDKLELVYGLLENL